MKKLPLHIKIILGLVLGIAWAFLSSSLGWNSFTITWIDPFGAIFIRLLKFIAVPLVMFSIISGVSGLTDLSKLGRLGGKTLGTYLVTTLVAISVGLLLVNWIKPGSLIENEQRIKNRISFEWWLRENNMGIPHDGKSYLKDPQYQSFIDEASQDSELSPEAEKKVARRMTSAKEQQEQSPLQFLVDMVPENITSSIANNGLMLQVIFFSIFFSIALVMIPKEKSAPITTFIHGMNAAFLRMVNMVMVAAPFFVFALLAGVIAKMADTPQEVLEIFLGLGSYSLTVVAGLFFLAFLFYPLLLRMFVSELSYKAFFKSVSPAQFLAFSTSSSAATLPVTMECVEENLGVSKRISSFVLPVGATVNMDGTSLYQAVAVVFLAQMHLVDLTFAQQLTIILTTTLASIGSAATPSAGLVMMIVVLQSVGLNPAWVAVIFPVDRILDMCRTAVNITGDTVVSTLIAKSEGELSTEHRKTQA